jgi:hypothetical protein
MNTVGTVLQVVVALGLLNVWILRFNKTTQYRGGNAKNLKEEFAAYGLPSWFVYVVGALKIGSALALLAGVWFPALVFPAAALVVLLMLGALAMHLKVGDPVVKSLPAGLMFLMGVIISLSTVN